MAKKVMSKRQNVSSAMTDEQKVEEFDKIVSQKEVQKKKDKLYWERTKWEIQQMKRVIMEKGLENELIPFPKTLADYI